LIRQTAGKAAQLNFAKFKAIYTVFIDVSLARDASCAISKAKICDPALGRLSARKRL
jgi:hypothetical protein